MDDDLDSAITRVSDNIRALAGLTEDTELASAAKQIEKLLDALPDDDETPEYHAQQEEILDIMGRIDRIVMTLERDFGSQRRR